MIPVTGSGRIPRKRDSFPHFPAGSGRKRHQKMKAVFRSESHRTRKRGSPQSSIHRIFSGNDTDPGRKQAGIQHFPPELDRNTVPQSDIRWKIFASEGYS